MNLVKNFKLFFSFDSDLLEGVTVDFDFQESQSLEVNINRLLIKTNFRYKHLGEKYYVIYQNDVAAKKQLKKMARKVKQLQQLEKKGGITLYRTDKKFQKTT